MYEKKKTKPNNLFSCCMSSSDSMQAIKQSILSLIFFKTTFTQSDITVVPPSDVSLHEH